MLQKELYKRRLKLYSLAGIVGVISGIIAVLFRWLILGLSLIFVIVPQVLGSIGWILTPILGAIVVAVIVVRFSPETKGSGIPEVMYAYSYEGGSMKHRIPLLKSIASSVCIASGG